jgi:hypothetical protein
MYMYIGYKLYVHGIHVVYRVSGMVLCRPYDFNTAVGTGILINFMYIT